MLNSYKKKIKITSHVYINIQFILNILVIKILNLSNRFILAVGKALGVHLGWVVVAYG